MNNAAIITFLLGAVNLYLYWQMGHPLSLVAATLGFTLFFVSLVDC